MGRTLGCDFLCFQVMTSGTGPLFWKHQTLVWKYSMQIMETWKPSLFPECSQSLPATWSSPSRSLDARLKVTALLFPDLCLWEFWSLYFIAWSLNQIVYVKLLPVLGVWAGCFQFLGLFKELRIQDFHRSAEDSRGALFGANGSVGYGEKCCQDR